MGGGSGVGSLTGSGVGSRGGSGVGSLTGSGVGSLTGSGVGSRGGGVGSRGGSGVGSLTCRSQPANRILLHHRRLYYLQLGSFNAKSTHTADH